MASVQGPQGPMGPQANKITKHRPKVVKPILKKLSHSEKNSLDLDRGWEEQPMTSAWGPVLETGVAGRSARDVNFQFDFEKSSYGGTGGANGIATGTGASGGVGRGGYQHVRSTSGTSHVSIATNGSGHHHHRTGSFVHPFQQTPRTSTPPLTYANSMASFDNVRDYSPTITETEDDDFERHSSMSRQHIYHPTASTSMSQSNLRRPSLASQRTNSADIAAAPSAPLRVNTGRTTPGPSSRLAHGMLSTSYSHSDLQLHLSALDSPISPTGLAPIASNTSSSVAPSGTAMSPLRTSLEGVGFRLRSRSELDAAPRREDIREARRKFEERERAKEEKYDREQIRRRERKDSKEASRIERAAARRNTGGSTEATPRPSMSRKGSSTPAGVGTPPPVGVAEVGGSGRGSTSSNSGLGAITAAAVAAGANSQQQQHQHHHHHQFGKIKKSKHERKGGGGNGGGDPAVGGVTDEKQMGFRSSDYDSAAPGTTPSFGPGVDDVQFRSPARRNTAKRKTQGAWTAFILWLRTRLLRLGKK